MTSVMMSGGKVKMQAGKVRVGAAGDPCCCGDYRQARRCSDDLFVDVWMTDADARSLTPGTFTIGVAGCDYFDLDDPLGSPGTIYTPADVSAIYDDCDSCGDPCVFDAPIDTSCPTLDLTYLWKWELFYSDIDDPCGGSVITSANGSGAAELTPGAIAGVNIGACACLGSESVSWSDSPPLDPANPMHGVDLCCPGGWRVIISAPINEGCCVSTRATGLSPVGNYPDVVCCEGPIPDGGSPTGFAWYRTTYTQIKIDCNPGI